MATIVTQEPSPAWSGARLQRLRQRSQALLEELLQVPGLQGSCLCDNRGGLLGLLLSATGHRRLFERMALPLCQCFAALEGRLAVRSLELRLERKVVVARDLGQALLVAVCAPEVNLPVLRMALEVATHPFETDADLQKSLAQVEPSRSATLSPTALDATARALLQRAGLRIA